MTTEQNPMALEVILASGSPRRRDLLAATGMAFTVRTPASPVDESLEPDQLAWPEEAAKKLAERKAAAVVQELLAESPVGMFLVLGADTMVVKDGRIAEQGSHEELMRSRGEYYQMQQAQFEGAFE